MTEFHPRVQEDLPSGKRELTLLQSAELRSPQAFAPIMRRYNQRLYRLAFGLMGEASEAEDVLQESYVRAFRGLSSFAGKSSLGTWLASIVRNEAIDRLRQRRVRQATLTLEADLRSDGQVPSILDQACSETPQFDPETDVARDELRDVLEQAIASLPEQFRGVFMLREVEGLSVQETADYLEIPVATVKTRDHRARSLLRERLSTQLDDATKRTFPFLGIRCDRLVARVLARLQQ